MNYTIPEIIKIFLANHLDLYKKMNEVDHAFGGWKPNKFHLEGSIWTHTCMVMKEAQNMRNPTLVTKLAALCHDLGKPFVYKDIDEKERRRFSQHEAVSTFYAKEVLESFDVSDEIKKRVLYVVANHGSMYNFFDDGGITDANKEKLAAKYSSVEFDDLVEFYKCDHEGRFFEEEQTDRCNTDVYHDFLEIKDMIEVEETSGIELSVKDKSIIVLIGPPRAGKSTWVANNYSYGTWVISRDGLVEDHGVGENYSEKWASLTPENQKEIDKILMQDFAAALKLDNDIIIDMTNMSKKSRKKWLHQAKGYNKIAKVFIESKSCLLSRNSPDKFIPEFIIDSMMKNFVYPLADEFDHVEVI